MGGYTKVEKIKRQELLEKGLKPCNACKEIKPIDQFRKKVKNSEERRSECMDCSLIRARKHKNIDLNRNHISKKQRESLLKEGKKKCFTCNEIKSISCFHTSKTNKDGYKGKCSDCRTITAKQSYREKNNLTEDQYLIDRKEKQELDEQKLQRCGCCKEIKSFDDFRNSSKTINGKKNTCRSCLNIKRIERRKKDHTYRLAENISNLIKISINRKGYIKNSQTEKILGCSIEKFKTYLENKFEPWMNWENRGKHKKGKLNYGWDLDHIIPISSATTEEEVLKLNHYTNFQPLCSEVNRYIKRDRLDYY